MTPPEEPPSKEGERVFDLTELAKENDSRSSSRRRLTLAIVIFAGAVAAAGIGLFVWGVEPGHKSTDIVQGAILGIGGFFIALYAVTLYRGMGPTPRRLVIGPRGFSLDNRPTGRAIHWSWDERNIRIVVYDARGLAPVFSSGRRRLIDFVMQARSGPQTPIPAEAFDLLIREAESHGLELIGDVSPPTGRSGVNTIVLRATRRS